MTSHEFARYLQAYLDGELGPSKALETEHHLEECPSCRRAVEGEQAFRTELGEKVRREPVPPHLEEKLRAAIGEYGERAWQPALRLGFGRRAWVTAASVLLLTLGGVLGYLVAHSFPRPGVGPLVQELVGEHMKSAVLDRPVEISSGNTRRVAFWFQGRMGYPVRVPDYSPTGIQLLGGRVTRLAGRRAATIVYEKGRSIISLFAFPRYGASLTGLEEIRRADRAFLVGEYRGQRMVLWDRGGVTYALVSNVGWDELFQCARVFYQGEQS
ncbi:MAG: anti-sigma factor family protein [Candidatus Methylomirabilales bacterium]